MSWVVFVQAMNLGLGNLTQNVHVLYNHPKTILVYSNKPSALDFSDSIISSLGIGSFFKYNRRKTVWIASGIDAFPMALLLPILGTTAMQLSRYIYIFT